MQLPLSLHIAFRFILSKNQNGFLSFISLASMIGLIIGVASLVVITSVMNGFEAALNAKILGMVPHASVTMERPTNEWQQLSTKIMNNDENVEAVAPFIRSRGMASIKGNVQGTIINGIIPKEQSKVSILNDSMVQGDINKLTADTNNIVLGKNLVETNGLKLGDEISIFLTSPSNSVIGIDVDIVSFTLVGVFDVSDAINRWMSFISMDDHSRILKLDTGAKGLRLKLTDVMKANSSAALASQSTELPNNKFTQWQSTHGHTYETIAMQKTMTSLLLFLVVLVAAFNIVSTLMMMVTEKKSNIAILKTIGFTPSMITWIFLYQGFILGLLGTVIGLVCGLGITSILSGVSFWVDQTFNLQLFNHYFVESLPTRIDSIDLVIICLSTMLVTIMSAIYPARKASMIEPAVALSSD